MVSGTRALLIQAVVEVEGGAGLESGPWALGLEGGIWASRLGFGPQG